LRVLEHGYAIVVCQTQKAVLEINTPSDLLQAQALIAQSTMKEVESQKLKVKS
jgi:3-deoxy-manno-octulosonate cytidylyltransferase (CMP-KDO synthetase)